MDKNRIKAFDGPGPGENPNGVRRIGSVGVGRGGIGDQGDEGHQGNWGPNIAGERWSIAPKPDTSMPMMRTGRRR